MDDLEVSYMDGDEIAKLGAYLKDIYEKADLEVTKHERVMDDYLGIGLEYSSVGNLHVSMIKYLQNTLDGFSGEIGKAAATPAAEHLFKTSDAREAEYLCKERAGIPLCDCTAVVF